jgi:uncharacterized membrane protein (UPF0127 family)
MNKLIYEYIKKNLIIFFLLSLTFIIFFFQFSTLTGYRIENYSVTTQDTVKIIVGKKDYNLFIAKTYNEVTNGLAKFDKINENEGMLFIFDTPGNYTFFMKDMKFNLDIIFIDETFKVVQINQNVKKETYRSPRDFEAIKPDAPIKYVIELNEGEVSKNKLKVGEYVNIYEFQR